MTDLPKPLRAVLCDVYGTLLKVQPPPLDAEEQWSTLWTEYFPRDPQASRDEVAVRCRQEVEHDHERARRERIRHPEVDWVSVMARALPELASRTESEQSDFVYAHMQLCHRVSLQPGAASFLTVCRNEGIGLALVSNAQAYTLRELDQALSGSGLSLASFESEWNFWSFVEGYSKPDTEVFHSLARRLAERSIVPGEVLMIGDRFDNDIAPAKEAGFAAWWLSENGDGDWFELGRIGRRACL